ncbi:MAG: ABC transporter permease [Selenomonadaceae bacterium]|nr:ABC transporter permease [Selenomonadaceae bacterium]
MKRRILNRLIQLIPIIIGLTFITFFMMRLSMTDAVDMMYGETGGASAEVMETKRLALGLNESFWTQYFNWIKNAIFLDFGNSYISGYAVFDTFLDKLPKTVLLTAVSLALTLMVSVPLGLIAAVKQNGKLDLIIRFFSFIGNSLPNFFVGLLLIYFLSLKLNLFPIVGLSDSLTGVILPAATLSVAMTAKYIRQIRALTLSELNKPYIIGARARGISEFNILFKSVLKSISLTLITLVALSVGSLLGGAAIVETVFMWDGVGKLAVDAINMRDYPMLQAYVLMLSVIYVVINLVADILYGVLDPRVKIGGNL